MISILNTTKYCNINVNYYNTENKTRYFILSSSKELTSWVKLQKSFVRQTAGAPYKRFLLAT